MNPLTSKKWIKIYEMCIRDRTGQNIDRITSHELTCDSVIGSFVPNGMGTVKYIRAPAMFTPSVCGVNSTLSTIIAIIGRRCV